MQASAIERVGRWRIAEKKCEHIEQGAADKTAGHVHCPEPVEVSELVWVMPSIDPVEGNFDSKYPCCLAGPSLGKN